jgi:hypothetical protein
LLGVLNRHVGVLNRLVFNRLVFNRLVGVLSRLVFNRHVGVLNRLVFNRHVGQGWRSFPEAHEPLADEERAGTGIRASHSERGSRRPGATSKQEDQRGRAGSRGERSEEGTSAHHGDARAGLSCPGGQFAPRNIHLLAGKDHSLLGRTLYQLFEWTLAYLFNSGHGHQALGLPKAVARTHRVTLPEDARRRPARPAQVTCHDRGASVR